MKQIILGTAGHIDHGKTSLIKAVTGTDTDRLKEEKLRGITIELGFAALDLPSGQHVGIVDVPGHEKFVKNMVAGASGIDIVVMVIAADEGVMPQTREHMEICSLLGIRHGFVAMTKIDMIDDPEWLELAMDDIQQFTIGSFLEDAPVVAVSSVKKQGLDDFVQTLDRLCRDVAERTSSGLFRLPVDRVFSMKGFGTVITGTLISGQVSVGDNITIYPSGVTSKVRGLQVHNQSVQTARAGMRTAINFQGLEKADIQRGEIIAHPGALKPSFMIDVDFKYLKSNRKALKSRTRVRFHSGTSEIMGNIILLDRDELSPGDSAIVQIRLDTPVALIRDDRYVIRSYSPVRTIGGGRIVNPLPAKHKRFRDDINARLNALAHDPPDQTIATHLLLNGYRGVSFDEFKILTNQPQKKLDKILGDLLSRREIVLLDKDSRVFVHQETVAGLIAQIQQALTIYHQRKPLKGGMPREELKSKFPRILNARLFTLALNQMIKANQVVAEKELVRLAGHKVSLGIDQSTLRHKLRETYQAAGLTPPYLKDMADRFDTDSGQVKDVMMLLVEAGNMVKIKEDLFFDARAVADLQQKVVDFLKQNQDMSTPQFKAIADVSRKYLIPLIEYFDSQHVTIRIGDIRQLRGSAD